ncbi:hypothetical protein FRC01_005516 [Tulasnella sp. 417]|nr:hypothetical protein FRC01_005516 [Tulasnella sp. 417]
MEMVLRDLLLKVLESTFVGLTPSEGYSLSRATTVAAQSTWAPPPLPQFDSFNLLTWLRANRANLTHKLHPRLKVQDVPPTAIRNPHHSFSVYLIQILHRLCFQRVRSSIPNVYFASASIFGPRTEIQSILSPRSVIDNQSFTSPHTATEIQTQFNPRSGTDSRTVVSSRSRTESQSVVSLRSEIETQNAVSSFPRNTNIRSLATQTSAMSGASVPYAFAILRLSLDLGAP